MRRITRVVMSAMMLPIGSTMMLGGCVHKGEFSPALRNLPAVRDVVPPGVKIPKAMSKADAVALAKRYRNAATEANVRLDTAASNYGEVRRRYGGSDE